MNKTVLLCGLILSVLFSCYSPKKISNRNVAFLYSHSHPALQPDHRIYHFSNDSSALFIRVKTSGFSYIPDAQMKLKSSYRISYLLYSNYESGELIDTGTTVATYYKSDEKEYLYYRFNFPSIRGQKYVLETVLNDLNSDLKVRNFFEVDRRSLNKGQNFISYLPADSFPLFEKHLQKNTRITISHFLRDEKFTVKKFNTGFRPAIPTFIKPKKEQEFSEIPETTYMIENSLTISDPGIYLIQYDSLLHDGYSILHFYNDYPELTKAEHLAEPLRYITKNEEYDRIINAENIKLRIDSFWLERAGSKERAKVLIKEYYSRVQDANRHFTSYLEGWKSDRGLVYIIYGEPDVIYKTSVAEKWIYEESLTEPAITFTFEKYDNPISSNHFVLKRDLFYENSWHMHIHKWRHGQIGNLRR